MTRRKGSPLLFFSIGLGAALAAGVYVLARAVRMTIDSWPDRRGEEVPARPSLQASLLYSGVLMPRKYLLRPLHMRSVSGWLRARLLEPVWLPSDIQVETVEGAGVPAEIFRARGASRSRFILYLHGGTIYGITNLHRY